MTMANDPISRNLTISCHTTFNYDRMQRMESFSAKTLEHPHTASFPVDVVLPNILKS